MPADVKLGQDIVRRLCCPICKSTMELADSFRCVNPGCRASFPVVSGIPILINESSSLFSIEDFLKNCEPPPKTFRKKLMESALGFIPSISLNVKAHDNYSYLSKLLLEDNPYPRVLIIGGRDVGQGMDALMSFPSIQIIESDVLFGPRTVLICDAHDIPFIEETFDAVVIQAVLEYVIGPHRCVEEIYRVLKPNGLVYSEVPFMQQIHGIEPEFLRFTLLGHRYLFRKFNEISIGPVCGPSMALAWSFRYFLLSFIASRFSRIAVYIFTAFATWWLKYLDYYLVDKENAINAASGFYFLGRKVNRLIPDLEIVKDYSVKRSL